jgi:hypothetical protein
MVQNCFMRSAAVMATALGFIALAVPASVHAEDQATVAAALQARQAARWPIVGAMVDVGVPDGLMASLVVRPWKWFRVYGGGGSNTVSKGYRGGFSLIPFGSGPALSLECGRYGEGNANGLVRSLAGDQWSNSPLLEKVGYDFANAHAGLEFGGKHFTFFVHGGVSMVWARIRVADGTVANTGSDTIVEVSQDPKVKIMGSSLKVGLILFLL